VLNASDDRGINVVREQIKLFCSTQQILSKGVKFVILDECDSMTNAAQMALRRVIEKFTRNTRFCLICNYASKIIPALQSRCTRFRFSPLNDVHVKAKLSEIALNEKLNLTSDAADTIISLSQGDMRKVLNILESCAMAHKEITSDVVYSCTGKPSMMQVDAIYNALLQKTYNDAYNTLLKLKNDHGLALDDILVEIHKLVLLTDMPDRTKGFLVKRMGNIEFRLAIGCDEKIQIAALVGGFIEARIIVKG